MKSEYFHLRAEIVIPLKTTFSIFVISKVISTLEHCSNLILKRGLFSFPLGLQKIEEETLTFSNMNIPLL